MKNVSKAAGAIGLTAEAIANIILASGVQREIHL